MPFDALKYMNRLKETISKYSADKMVHTDLQIFNRPSHPFNIHEYVKLGEEKLNSVHQSVQKIYRTAVGSNTKTNDSHKAHKRIKLWKRIDQISYSKFKDISSVSQILNSLEFSFTDEQILIEVESLISLLKQHPEVRNKAAQNGALRILLNKGLTVTNELAKGSIREALTILGYVDPIPGKGIRILSIDGGGIRGVLVLEMLKKLEELTGKKTYQLFDFICGVSTGAILSYSIGVHFRDLDAIIERYEELSQEIFNQSAIRGTGNLVWSHGYYNTGLWEQRLKEYLGSATLISTSRNPRCPKLCIVAAIVNQAQVSAYLFRNYALPWRIHSQYEGTYDSEVWQAARASAAAPTYFEEFKLRDLILQDGAILVNNPTAIAIHEAKLLWPNTPIQCVVSFGTGRIISNRSEINDRSKENKDRQNVSTSWTDQFYKILDSATDTQAVHIMLGDLLAENVYYRFNPYLTEMIGMVETDKEKQEQLKRDALMYLRRNEDKFHHAAKTLTLKKTIKQKIRDKVQFQKDLYGL